DAIILSVIIRDLGTQDPDESKCFLRTNVKDFRYPGIRAELKSLNCRYISRLGDGLAFIDNASST
ncbi:MAG TPA: PIN domain-containing protein, partial [Chloroflexia bacterium]